jgi:hypothetical protein
VLSFGGTDLFDRADSDTIGFAQSTIDGAGFRDTHFSALHEERDIGRVGVAVPNESLARSRLINNGFERIPTIS